MPRITTLLVAGVGALSWAFTWSFTWAVPAALAADYPTRPVTLVVAFTPGGPSDVLARIVGKKLEQLLGQPFVIENRPGAGGNVAAEQVARAPPDGYTLLMGNNSILATNAALYKKINFDPEKRFRADQPDRLAGEYPGGQSAAAGAHDGRADRARQGQSGQAQLCLLGLWRGRASRRRAVQGGGQDRHRARPLQGRGAGAAGRDRRPCADDVCDRGLGGAAHPERPGAAARGDDAQAHGGAARIFRPSTSSASRASTPPPGTAWSRPRARRRT